MTLDFALLLAFLVLLAAIALIAARRWLPANLQCLAAVGVLGAAALLLIRSYLQMDTERLLSDRADYPIQRPANGYVSSGECKACHPREYSTWHASFHRTMTQRPSATAVAGAFDVVLRRGDERYDLRRGDRSFDVEMAAPAWWHGPIDQGRLSRPVALMTGSHNYQVYWLSTGNSRLLEQFPFVYLIAERLWVPRRSVFMIPPGAVQVAEYGRWNTTCLQCHTTNGRPRVNAKGPLSAAFTEVSEYGIACEACHGPGDEHVARMRNPLPRYAAHLGSAGATGIIHPGKLEARRSVYVCGQCHSVRSIRRDELAKFSEDGVRFRPGDDLAVSFDIADATEAVSDSEHFWPDGMARVVGREMNGLLASPCFASGKFSCLSCHEPHQQVTDPRSPEQWRDGLLKASGSLDKTCVNCHAAFSKDAAVVAHTHHPRQSAGSQCANCHMPYVPYGLGKLERSHQISSPDARVDLGVGRPNACNLCHLDRSLSWTARALADWYGQPTPEMDAPHREIAESVLMLYTGDANQRALAIWSMGWEDARHAARDDWVTPHLVRALDDPYEVLGLVAWRALRKIHDEAQLPGRILMASPGWRADEARKTLQGLRPSSQNPATLIGADGNVDGRAADALIERRNNRPVVLAE